ncbi:MAG: YihY family inner membrane protein [Planctomycetota bacterium]|nr:YihY family inner membrane protein [Planctomycetota bacterium]
MSRLLETITQWLKRVVTQPLQELDRYQMAVRGAYDLGRFGARQLQHDRASEMAAALAFRTLFGLLPVLVVTTMLVKGFGGQQQFLGQLDELLEYGGLHKIQILMPAETGGATQTLAVWLRDNVLRAEQINVAAIGWVGVALTIYSAISLVVTVEDCFNTIYRAPQGRPWIRRVPLYWFVLTISPLLVVCSTYANIWFEDHLARLQTQVWLTASVGLLWSLFTGWMLMLAVYMLFPNTAVHRRPAMVGALVAALLLEIGKRTLGLYFEKALSLSQLYGSLGLIPLFMFWVYLMWLAVLFGLQVSATLQHLHGRRVAELQEQRRWESALIDPAVVVMIMERIAAGFMKGQTTTVEQIARTTGLTEPVVDRLLTGLVHAEMVHRVADAESSVALRRPPEEIPLDQLLEIAFQSAQRDGGGDASHRLLEQLRMAQKAATAHATLRTLLVAPAMPPRED